MYALRAIFTYNLTEKPFAPVLITIRKKLTCHAIKYITYFIAITIFLLTPFQINLALNENITRKILLANTGSRLTCKRH